MFTIRRYQPVDFEQVMTLHIETMKAEHADQGSDPGGDDLLNIQNAYFDQRGEFLVGLDDDRIVAIGAFRQSDDISAELRFMRVHPSKQGRGYGARMLWVLEEHAVRLGYQRLHLEAPVLQTVAQGLYQSHGYFPYDKTVTDGCDSILYEKYI